MPLSFPVLFLLGTMGAFVGRWMWRTFCKYRRLIHYMDLLPGEKGRCFPLGHYFMLGSTHDKWLRDLHDLVNRGAHQSPLGVVQLWLGPLPIVVLTKGASAEVVLSSARHIEKGRAYHFLKPRLGTGLLTSTGDKWRGRRKFLTPAFHFQILTDFLEVFYEQSLVLVQELRNNADGRKEFDVYPYITRCTLDIICETAMGQKINAQTNHESDYVKAIYSVSDITFDRMIKPAWLFDTLFYTLGRGRKYQEDLKTLHDFTDRVILERKADGSDVRRSSAALDGAESKRPRMAFLDSLLQARTEDGLQLDNASIREEVDTFMFEGHDSTAAAANFATYLLGAHPQVQVRAREEVDGVFGLSQRCPTVDDLKNLPYLEKVIKETLRLFPSVPIITRKVREDFRIGPHLIPKDTCIMIFIYTIHRNPQVFSEPDKFDPERFDAQGDSARGHDTPGTIFDYVPFSAGPRNCIGQKFALMEQKTILSTLLRDFIIESMVPLEEFAVQGQLIMRAVNGVHVRLQSRSPSLSAAG